MSRGNFKYQSGVIYRNKLEIEINKDMQAFYVDIWEVKLVFQFSTEIDLFNQVTLNCNTQSCMH